MIVRVRDVRIGEKILAETTLLVDAKGTRHGLVPLGGLSVVGGSTGSGKTLLAEALWLGISWSVAQLAGLKEVVLAVYNASAIRPLSLVFEAEMEDHEIPGGARIAAKISRGVLESINVNPETVDKQALAYALAHVVSLPHTLRETFYSSSALPLILIKELVFGDKPCDLLLPIVPPVAVRKGMEEYYVCHARAFNLEVGVVLEEKEGGGYYAGASTGEISREILRYYREALQALRERAKELGVSLMPMAIIDDAFDGLDGRALVDVAKSANSPTWSLYALTHRTEAADYAERVLVLGYGLRANNLASKPSDFRFALIDIERLDYDLYLEFCEKVIVGDKSRCEQVRE